MYEQKIINTSICTVSQNVQYTEILSVRKADSAVADGPAKILKLEIVSGIVESSSLAKISLWTGDSWCLVYEIPKPLLETPVKLHLAEASAHQAESFAGDRQKLFDIGTAIVVQ